MIAILPAIAAVPTLEDGAADAAGPVTETATATPGPASATVPMAAPDSAAEPVAPPEPVAPAEPTGEPTAVPRLAPAPDRGATSAARAAPSIAPLVTVTVPTPAARAIPTIQPTVTVAPASASTEVEPTAGEIIPPAARKTPDGIATGQLAGARPVNAGAPAVPPEPAGPTSSSIVAPFKLLGETVQPGAFAQLTWYGTETFTSASIPSAVLVAHGSSPGPVICITAAIHGDELNGIETVRRIMHDLDPTRLSGTVVGVPIVNIQGFHRSSRYLPDRRDLNRYFPGNPNGSSASRIAYSLFYNVIVNCNALVDLHTGSFHRTNLPQVRADLNDPGAVAITQGFGSTVILHSDGESGTLRAAATRAGIPAVTFEAGAPMQVQEDAVRQTEQGIRILLDTLGVYRQPGPRSAPAPAYYQSRWVRTDHGGILSGRVSLGTLVVEGDLLGTVIDPLTNQQQEIRSPLRGRIIGMALDQFVMPGYATFHIGIEAPVDEVIESTPGPEPEHEAAEVEQERGYDPS